MVKWLLLPCRWLKEGSQVLCPQVLKGSVGGAPAGLHLELLRPRRWLHQPTQLALFCAGLSPRVVVGVGEKGTGGGPSLYAF